MKITPSNTSGKIKARLQDIEIARSNGASLKDVWEALTHEGYINCSYNVFGNTLRRLKKVDDLSSEKVNKQSVKIAAADKKNAAHKKLKKSGNFVEKPEINLDDFNEDE